MESVMKHFGKYALLSACLLSLSACSSTETVNSDVKVLQAIRTFDEAKSTPRSLKMLTLTSSGSGGYTPNDILDYDIKPDIGIDIPMGYNVYCGGAHIKTDNLGDALEMCKAIKATKVFIFGDREPVPPPNY